MDALPFPSSDASTQGGADSAISARHACGHDMHAAILLGLARFLADRRDELGGTARLLFQPAEEVLSKDSGAHRLVALGALRDPAVSRIYALHVSPRFRVGMVAYRPGAFMAECRRLILTVTGRGGHGASAGRNVDPVNALAKILVTIADGANGINPARGLASFCRVHGGTAPNVRPAAVTAEGTLRATVPGAASGYAHQLRERVATIALDYPELTVTFGCELAYPLLVNSGEVHPVVLGALTETVGPRNVQAIDPLLASEDFAVYLEHCPGAMFLLGVKDDAPRSSVLLHCQEFKGSDDALMTGVRCFAAIAQRELGGAA